MSAQSPFDPEEFRMPLMEHLKELRYRLIVSMAAALAGCLGCFYFTPQIWDFLVAPMQLALEETGKGSMAINEPLEGVVTQLKVAGVAGLGAASPIIFYQIWRFIAPGLYPTEQRFIAPLAFFSSLLFITGVVFGYFVIFRYAFPFFLQVTPENVEAVLSINSYLALATKMLLAFGACFQLPVGAFALARAGLIDHKDMINSFRYAIVAIFVANSSLSATRTRLSPGIWQRFHSLVSPPCLRSRT